MFSISVGALIEGVCQIIECYNSYTIHTQI